MLSLLVWNLLKILSTSFILDVTSSSLAFSSPDWYLLNSSFISLLLSFFNSLVFNLGISTFFCVHKKTPLKMK